MTQRRLARRAFLGAAFILPVGACSKSSWNNPLSALMPYKPFTLSERGDRMVRWLYYSGKEAMLAPDALSLMGLENGGRYIPVKQLAEDGPDGRYVISLVNIRKIHEFVLHRRRGDLLIIHQCDTAFRREMSVRFPRDGKPTVITDTSVAEADFQEQLAFWFARMPAR
ncbi:hypothetical protein SAMN02745126_01364 [Enhydrobacter aerosaccus]|uniref:Lipoprotein n=1 Tax=Enhydrobacter aerosaccus TaxID=225324 RepID=A0A1T4L635_9HYPH|nr:hypothetical protein [Enhydrobacter aerosaccus]SJZ50030.1 hypothetical protein SAMN02745126_01364 [Enhydrobacter aerosaccus]